MEFLIGRQAILDRAGNTFGYELLYRETSSSTTSGKGTDSTATLRVIINAFINIGIDRIAKRGKLFINFTQDLLIERIFKALPPNRVVVEVLENVSAEKEVIAALKEAKMSGFLIALDDFVFLEHLEELVKLTDIVKVDFLELGKEEIKKEIEKYKNYNVKLLAEKVETPDDYEFALKTGFHYFQGYYFQRPTIEAKKDLSPYQISIMKALRLANDPNATPEELTELINGDLYLHTKLLAFVNSPAWEFKRRIKTIKDTVRLLGMQRVREWLNMLLIAKLSDEKPQELVVLSTVRARFMWLISDKLSLDKENAYLLGMYSLMDAILEVPMERIVNEMNYLDKDVKDALLGKENRCRKALKLIELLEKGRFDLVYEKLNKINLDAPTVLNSYMESIEYADMIYSI